MSIWSVFISPILCLIDLEHFLFHRIISSSATMPKRPRLTVFDKDLKPAQRAIPDTSLLHNLGNHLSVYARAGRVRHIALLFFMSITYLFFM